MISRISAAYCALASAAAISFCRYLCSLSAITWPDIPEDYKGIFGWVGDTIPEFVRSKTDYKVTVPWDVDGIPALVAKNEDDNARHEVKRATNLAGSVEYRTVMITSTAENDTTILI